jgi:hypothetical protein
MSEEKDRVQKVLRMLVHMIYGELQSIQVEKYRPTSIISNLESPGV